MATTTQNQAQIITQRRSALIQENDLFGIDFIKVGAINNNSVNIEIYFVKKTSGRSFPTNIKPENVKITKGANKETAQFAITFPANQTSTEKVDVTLTANDASELNVNREFTLSLINILTIDPFFNEVKFYLATERLARFDCQTSNIGTAVTPANIEIDYLTKDFNSFRQLMLNRLSILMPNWQAGNTIADVGGVLVEALSYAADHLSYYQDAIANEAYLGTARRRISIKRHARLLDYNMHEGVNARVWVHCLIKADIVDLKSGTVLFTRTAGFKPSILKNSIESKQLPQTSTYFETLYPVKLFKNHNKILFYNWGAEQFNLKKGATKATLADHYNLSVGQVIIFEQVLNATTGTSTAVDPTKRHVVRLSKVFQTQDKLGGKLQTPAINTPKNITEIEWFPQDALPFDLCVTNSTDKISINNVSVARGNIVLADYGRSYNESDALVPNVVPKTGIYNPYLKRNNITFATDFDITTAATQAASVATKQDPRIARPAVKLIQGADIWQSHVDLLESNRLDQNFVLEIENNRRAFVRFGNGEFGRLPPPESTFSVRYRIGNGVAGNIGAESLAHIVTDKSNEIESVRNLLAAQGGIDPEPIKTVRLDAPKVSQVQQRAVTTTDYATITAQYPGVKSCAAIRRWVGTWDTFFIAVERKERAALDAAFKQEIVDYLAGFQLINHEIEVIEPKFVALDINIVVRTKTGFLADVVRRSLEEKFSNKILANGQLGFFHPDNFGFGKDVYLSRIIAAAVSVPGVDYVNVNSPKMKFQRHGNNTEQSLMDGVINIRELEIVQVENNPALSEKGNIQFFMESSI